MDHEPSRSPRDTTRAMREDPAESLLALGVGLTEGSLDSFVLGDPVDGDPMFRQATLPAGWKREGSDHAMWSYLVDADGFRRAQIFYKAAWYDRSAHISLNTVYSYVGTCLYEKSLPEIKGNWATREAVLEAIGKHRDYHAEQVAFWTEHSRPEHVTDHEARVQICDRFREQIAAAGSGA